MRETEKFNRALRKFIEDNPDIDFEEAKRDFIELYNNGEYVLEDDFEKAEELYNKSLNAKDIKEARRYVLEAIEVCPYHFDSKCQLLNIENAGVLEYENLLAEIKEYLDEELDIDFDNVEESLWLVPECRPYLRTMHTAMLKARFDGDLDKAIKFNLELIRLDENCKLDQEFFLICCYLEALKLDEIVKYFDLLPGLNELPTHYLFLKFITDILLGNEAEASKLIEDIHARNPYYFGIITGIVKLEEEDFNNLMSVDFYLPGSIEEAIIYIDMMNVVMEKYTPNIHEYIEKCEDIIEKIFIPEEKDSLVLMAIDLLQSATIYELVTELRGKSKRLTPIFGALKKESHSLVEQRVLKLIDKGFIEQVSEKKYSISFYGFSVLEFLDDAINEE